MPGFPNKCIDVLCNVSSREKEQTSFASSIWNNESIAYHEFDKKIKESASNIFNSFSFGILRESINRI